MSALDHTSQLTPDSADAPLTDPIRVAATFANPAADAPNPGGDEVPAGPGDDLSRSGDGRSARGGRSRHSVREGLSTRGGRSVRRWAPAVASAAATVAVLAVGLGFAGAYAGGDADLAMEKDVMMVTSAPDATSMDLDLGNGHLVKSERMDAFALMGAAAPMPDKGTEYQVWLILEDGSKIAGPTFMPDDDGEYMTVFHSDVDSVVAVVVTCEPPGGSDEPTTVMVSVVDL